MLALVFVIAALVLFVLGAVPVQSRFNLQSAGLACCALAWLAARFG